MNLQAENLLQNRHEIPFEMHNGFIIVDLVLEKKLPLKFIFDTGAEHSLITKKELVDYLKLSYVKRFKILGADLSQEMYALSLGGAHLKLHGIDISDQALLVLEEDYFRFEEYIGLQVHGVLGMHYFRNCSVRINYRKKTLVFTPKNKYKKPSKKYTAIPIEIKKNKPYVKTTLQLNKTTTLSLDFLLDTGASVSLLIHNNTHSDLELPDNIAKGNLGLGLGGMLEGYVGRLEQLNIGPFEFQNIVTNYMELSEIQSSNKTVAYHGLIGNLLLSRFDVIIDYPQKLLYLKPHKKYNREFEIDKSGLTAIAAGKKLNQFYIQNIISNSSAGQAGLLIGDEILKFNGRTRVMMNLERIQKILQKKEGKKIKMTVKRGEKKVKVQFNLRKIL